MALGSAWGRAGSEVGEGSDDWRVVRAWLGAAGIWIGTDRGELRSAVIASTLIELSGLTSAAETRI